MAYVHMNSMGVSYFLCRKQVTLRGGKRQAIYYFSKNERPECVGSLPPNYTVDENARNGFLTLRRGSSQTSDVDAGASAAPAEPYELRLELAEGRGRLIATAASSIAVALGADELFAALRRAVGVSARLAPAVIELEELIATTTVREAELQRFLEDYPELLMGSMYEDWRAQVVLETPRGRMRPDFILKPLGGRLWDVVELKLPQTKVLTRSGLDVHLTRAASRSVSQLLRYDEALRQEEVRERLAHRYGIEIFRPRLHLVIGRAFGRTEADIRRASDPRVEISPWDVLAVRARRRLA